MSISQESLVRHLFDIGSRLQDELIVNYAYNEREGRLAGKNLSGRWTLLHPN